MTIRELRALILESHYVVVNISGGKDSTVILDMAYEAATAGTSQLDKMVLAHADLGRSEWPGTLEFVERLADYYDMPLFVKRNPKGDLLQQIAGRGKWPSPACRFCTSDHKRGQLGKLFTAKSREAPKGKYSKEHPLRVLNIMGMRADESSGRAKLPVVGRNKHGSCGFRTVTDVLPAHDMTTQQVWDYHQERGLPHHYPYDLGMPRLSCAFCIYAPKDALVIAGTALPELLDLHVEIEEAIEHTFKQNLSLKSVREMIQSGYQPNSVQSWTM